MARLQFRVLYREFLFRMVDLELLSAHAQGDMSKLFGQFAALFVFLSMLFAGVGLAFAGGAARMPLAQRLIFGWVSEHFLIATTMLVVGLFAVLSWDSTFPARRDVLVLALCPCAPALCSSRKLRPWRLRSASRWVRYTFSPASSGRSAWGITAAWAGVLPGF